ncbi:hypothetical protein JTE90_005376 [Oedothorax gibbosus]|uniref:Uncharacterized protein n=1 Tax=Oedothorax gibbosus TaxID=931172 RepID=A0AAV6TMY2_9ARAC|nr:hypothetical protein JTE90_005376 [Oedothorax gibbosus]
MLDPRGPRPWPFRRFPLLPLNVTCLLARAVPPHTLIYDGVAQPQRSLTGGPISANCRPDPSLSRIVDIRNDNSPREICCFMLNWSIGINAHIATVQHFSAFLDNLGPHEVRNRDIAINEINKSKATILFCRKKLEELRACPVTGCMLPHTWNTDFLVSMEPAVQSPPPPEPLFLSSHPIENEDNDGFKTVTYRKRKPTSPKGTSSPILRNHTPSPPPSVIQDKTESWIRNQNSFAPLENHDASQYVVLEETVEEPPTYSPPPPSCFGQKGIIPE